MRPGLALAAAALLAAAAAPAPATGDEIARGAALYATYCAACHGPSGRGGGPVADLLAVPVPDLTTIAARHGGAFPRLEVIQIIDGRTGLRVHGGSMPLWGSAFAAETGGSAGAYGAEPDIRARVLALARYLETLQE